MNARAVAVNVTVVALTLAGVAGLARLFTDPARFFLPVALVAVIVHVLCWGARRLGWGLPLAAAVVTVATVLVVSWLVFASSTAYGMPDHATAHAAHLELSAALRMFHDNAVPVPVIAGFTMAGAVGAAIAAFLADWAAFRMRATIEACLPSFSLFVLSAALAQGRNEITAGLLWLAALLAFLLMSHPSMDTSPSAWFASRARKGTFAMTMTGLGLGASAVAVAAAVGPQLPGATVHPLYSWRHSNNQASRTIGVSPLVDITARLQSQNHDDVFTVAASRPTYWRLTSLDHFQNNGWSLQNDFVQGSRRLPTDGGPSTILTAQVRITGLSSIWLPAPYRPVAVSGVSDFSFSTESGSLITNKTTSDGLTYVVQSAVPTTGPQALAAAAPPNPSDPTLQRYLQLPTLPPQVLRIARDVTAGAGSEYAKALALQNWLRSPPFRYDLNVKADDSPNALLNFLTQTRAGFCQQFAASYAVLARAIGLPTRVAIGFTEGDLGADGAYHVSDAQAHAWPEVYFPGVGWIGFEPTPGRGSPDPTEQLATGVAPAQDSSGPTNATGATAPPAPGPSASTATTLPTGAGKDQAAPGALKGPGVRPWWDHSRLPAKIVSALAVVAAVWVGLLAAGAWVIRRRRAGRVRSEQDIVDLAWIAATEALTAAGVAPRPSDTPAEFARRARTALGVDVLGDLAQAVEVADYSPVAVDVATATAATDAAGEIGARLRETLPPWARVLRLVDPRPLSRQITAELDRR